MKNISRRVFIKGMAVAAVATAASTVLAGCNVPGTTGEGAPVTGFASQTKTMTLDDDVALTITTTSSAVTADKKIKVGITMVNKTGKTVYFHSGFECNKDVNLTTVAYFDDDQYVDAKEALTNDYEKNMEHSSTNFGKDGFKSDVDNDTGLSSTYTHKGYLYFEEPKEWSKMTVVITASNYAQKGGDKVNKELVFTINK